MGVSKRKDLSANIPMFFIKSCSTHPIIMNVYQIISNEDLEDLREMGSGAFGTVFHGKWKGTDVAIKRIKNSCFMLPSSQADKLVSLYNFTSIFLSHSQGVPCPWSPQMGPISVIFQFRRFKL